MSRMSALERRFCETFNKRCAHTFNSESTNKSTVCVTAPSVEFSTGINLWAEWAKIEMAYLRNAPYQLPERGANYSAVMNCLARQEHPDLSAYSDPEVVWRLHKKHHAGLILSSPDPQRLEALLTDYSQRFAEDFLAVMPPKESGF